MRTSRAARHVPRTTPPTAAGMTGLRRVALAADLPDPGAADRSFPAAFAEQVRRTAPCSPCRTPSSASRTPELDERAGRVAAALASAGGPPERPVLVLARHGAPAVVALVGVAMSGRPYVVLDPTAPAPARQRVADRFPGSAVVTDRDHAPSAAPAGGCRPGARVGGPAARHGTRRADRPVRPDVRLVDVRVDGCAQGRRAQPSQRAAQRTARRTGLRGAARRPDPGGRALRLRGLGHAGLRGAGRRRRRVPVRARGRRGWPASGGSPRTPA